MKFLQALKTNSNNESMEVHLKEIQHENVLLKSVVQRMDSQVNSIVEKLEDIMDHVNKTNEGVEESKTTNYIGKKPVLLPQAREKVSKFSNNKVRSLIHRAAKHHPGGKRKGYTYIYERLNDLTGVDIYLIGKTKLTKSDNIDGWKKDPSYINTILVEGIQKEAAIIAMEVINNKII